MWELDHKEGWSLKNWCFWTVVLEKTLESPLDCKEIQPIHPKGSQSWIFIGRTDAEAETLILCPPDAKSWLIGKELRKTEGRRRRGWEDEMVGWHHWLNGHESEQAPGVGDGQGSLACCSPWGRKEWDTTEPLNWTQLSWIILFSGVPDGKESTGNAADLGSVSGLESSPREGNGYQLQYSCLENSMQEEPSVVTKSQTRLNDWPTHTSPG